MQLLQGQAAQGAALPRPITPHAYVALLPTVWSLANAQHSGMDDQPVLAALVDHAIKASSTSAVKRHTIEFLGRLVLVRR